MTIRTFIWVSFFSLLMSMQASAFTLNGKIQGGVLRWDNAMPSITGIDQTLTSWEPVFGLQHTKSWRPGAFISNGGISVPVSGPSSLITLPIYLVGVEYNTGSANPTISEGIGNGISNVCGETTVTSGNSFLLRRREYCVAPFSLDMPDSGQPFYFIRPIFIGRSENIVSKFSGKEEGIFTGSLPVIIYYEYLSANGTTTYRALPQILQIQIEHKPSFLTSVDVLGNGIMPPIYDQLTHKVSATTTFAIQANGYFGNGLTMSFQQRSYELVGPTNIPYSIVCDGACSQTNIVTAGVLNHNSVVVSTSDSNKTTINFNLNVSYDNIDITEVETGTYSDNFIVMFEVNL